MFVHVHHGDSPLIITVPHDGKLLFKGLPQREQVRGWYALGGPDPRDENTLPIAVSCADLLGTLGINPTIIWVSAHRGHLDVNRSPHRGNPYVSSVFRKSYEQYHSLLDESIARSVKTRGRALHIDLHGFLNSPSQDDYEMVFGTREHLTSPHGSDKRLANCSKRDGYRAVFSPNPIIGISPRYQGGWTVRRVADKHHNSPVDSVQIELHLSIRTKDKIKKTAKSLARILACELK